MTFNFIAISLVFFMTISLAFSAHYGSQCSTEENEEQQCGESETCCSRTVTGFDNEHNEIITHVSAGCCGYKDGVCCAEIDGCCPNGYTCDSHNRKCLKEVIVESSQVTCPDGSPCSLGQTCCKIPGTSRYGCCFYSNGVCCSDSSGCCPNGYICENQSCRGPFDTIPMAIPSQPSTLATRSTDDEAEMLSLNKREWDGTYISCPNGSKCLHGNTCCKLEVSKTTTPFGCCPYYNAICCKDSNYCCPQNRPCDPTNNQCIYKTSKRGEEEIQYIPAYKMD